jgi:predicted nucleic-acid-binding Zn-ribbon protein
MLRLFLKRFIIWISKYIWSKRYQILNNNAIQCKFCGYTPPLQEQPRSGTWFCPKCGKRVLISQPVILPGQKITKSSRKSKKTRDQITNQIYSKITKNVPPDLGLKEKYLNPRLEPIVPKKRKKIRIFSKGKEK